MKYIVLVNMLHVGWVFHRKTDINEWKAREEKGMLKKSFDDSETPLNEVIIELNWNVVHTT